MSSQHLYCMGNPLLDISAEVTDDFLSKYGIQLNNAILAEEKHMPMFNEMEKDFSVSYIAGGATQNSARVCKWLAGDSAKVSYVGCVGDDEYGNTLAAQAQNDGVNVRYKRSSDTATGTCAVCVHSKERSLVASLGAAEKYTIDHLQTSETQALLNSATHVYIGGFFLTHSADSILEVCKNAAANNRVMCMNTSAPFLLEVPFFAEKFKEFWPYLDYVFGNESEAASVAKCFGWDTTDVKEIAKKAAAMPKENSKRVRYVVFTQGCDETVVAGSDGSLETFPVHAIPASAIVDTNGAGDSFVGGFLAALMAGKSHDVCAAAGAYCGGMIIQCSGCTLPKRAGDFTQKFL